MAKTPNTNPQAAKKNKKKKRKKRNPVLSVFLGIICIGVLTVCVLASYVLGSAIMYVNGEIAVNLDDYKDNQDQTSFIYAYDENGETVEIARLHGEENRVWVDLDDMSPHMTKAFIALEDKRFKEHHGVDWIRTGGVIVKKQNQGQGGSTITQQLIKNLTKQNEVTIVRKITEILTALNVEKNYDKDEIIETYLNTLYLGSGCYGVQTASEKYFGKDVSELNLAECAVIAAITQNPSQWHPLIHPDRNRTRQVECLDKMLAEEMITQAEYDEAYNYELIFTNSENYVPDEDEKEETKKDEDKINSFYVDYVIECVRDDLMEKYGYSKQQAIDEVYGGLKIYTAVDLKVQEELEDVYENRINFPKLYTEEDGDPVQSAMTIMDYSGRVVAIVGQAGPKAGNRCLNRAANSYRQPGSTIKPLATYAPAIEMDLINFSSKIKDYAIAVNGNLWPHNVDQTLGSGSNVTVQYAVQESLNTVPARVINYDIGIDNSYEFIRDRFFLSRLDETEDRQLAPLATGALYNGTTTVEMAAAYATFGNGGLYYEPYSYYKVTSSDGKEIILSNENVQGQQVISPETSSIMCHLLQTVNTSYYGEAKNVRKFQIMAKTGTTTNNTNRWFCAGTPYYVTAVWVGFDIPESMNVNINPGGEICFTVFNRIHKNLDEKEFPECDSVIEKTYCESSGLIAGPNCGSKRKGWYKIDSVPATCYSCTAAPPEEGTGNAVVDEVIDNLNDVINDIVG